MDSPLCYLGGKSRLAKRIVEMIPDDHLCYCEAFCGAAWVLFAKEPSKAEVINDADAELATFWRVVQNHYTPFLDLFRHAVVSRQIFDWESMKRPETLTDLQRAARYFYLQRCGFGGKTFKRTFGVSATSAARLNLSTIEEDLLRVHWRLKRVTVECLDAMDCIRRYDRPTTVFYLDPPYWGTEGYAVPWPEERYSDLATVLGGIQGRFILSLNDTAAVRKTFSAFQIKPVATRYSCTNGRATNHGRAEPAREVLIHNV